MWGLRRPYVLTCQVALFPTQSGECLAMSYEQILYDVSDRILTITLNRPDRLNAYTRIMQAEMIDALHIRWPGGPSQTIRSLPVNRRVRVVRK